MKTVIWAFALLGSVCIVCATIAFTYAAKIGQKNLMGFGIVLTIAAFLCGFCIMLCGMACGTQESIEGRKISPLNTDSEKKDKE